MCTIVQCAIVGDCYAGKTSLLSKYIQKRFQESYEPTTSCERYSAKVTTNDDTVNCLDLWETSGDNDYLRLRTMVYEVAEIVLLCLSLENAKNISNIRNYWLPEIRKFYKRSIPIILVGTKLDIRGDKKRISEMASETKSIDYAQGFTLAKEIGAVAYVECSARKEIGLDLLFDTVAASAIYSRLQKERRTTQCSCSII